MDNPGLSLPVAALAAVLAMAAAAIILGPLRIRLQLSRAKHRSLAGHSRWSQRIARLVPFYGYDERHFFRSDGAPEDVAVARRAGFMRLAQLYRERFTKSAAQTAEAAESVSDM